MLQFTNGSVGKYIVPGWSGGILGENWGKQTKAITINNLEYRRYSSTVLYIEIFFFSDFIAINDAGIV